MGDAEEVAGVTQRHAGFDEGLDCLGGYPAGVGLHLGHAGAGCDRPGNLLGDAGGTSKERRVRGA